MDGNPITVCNVPVRAGAHNVSDVHSGDDVPVTSPIARRRSSASFVVLAAALLAVALCTAGCGRFGGGSKSKTTSVSVFDVKPGQCFNPPSAVKSELSNLSSVPCTQPHTQEAYATVNYANKDGSAVSAYPGDAVLKSFADGLCAQDYTGYVGKDYLDSANFFTYLLPSARGWEQQNDHSITCFVTTTGKQLTASVKGSKS